MNVGSWAGNDWGCTCAGGSCALHGASWGAWTASAGVQSKADAIEMAKWALAMGAGEAKAAGRNDVAASLSRYSANAAATFGRYETGKVFGAVVNTLGAHAPQTAARVKQLAYAYAVKYEGWGQKGSSAPSAAPSSPALPATSADASAEPFYKRTWFLPAVVIGSLSLVFLGVLVFGGRRRVRAASAAG